MSDKFQSHFYFGSYRPGFGRIFFPQKSASVGIGRPFLENDITNQHHLRGVNTFAWVSLAWVTAEAIRRRKSIAYFDVGRVFLLSERLLYFSMSYHGVLYQLKCIFCFGLLLWYNQTVVNLNRMLRA